MALLSASACFLGGVRAEKKIGDAVQSLNDQARWARIQDASMLVQPDYRDKFLSQHRSWGADIQVADAEVLNIQLAQDAEHASAFVTYSWYAMSDMTAHETTLKQLWTARSSSFALASETVVRGDPGLLLVAQTQAVEPVNSEAHEVPMR
ncbi:MAG: hypothetical protein RL701_2684 [Pseudomonadota bacterium]|jgi:hypothetical protein